MLEKANGRCEICNRPFGEKEPVLDHNHATGEARGLLCNLCNQGIGCLRDDPQLIRAALDYLSGR
jgi:hypothetical protein